jgi:osmotically inducible lipoprotein OsmB
MKKVNTCLCLVLIISTMSCANMSKRARNASIGAGVGAVGGGVLGHQKKKKGQGALIGGLLGGLLGFFATPKEEPKRVQQPSYNEQETITLKRKKVIEVEEQVPVEKETRRYYYKNGKKIYLD